MKKVSYSKVEKDNNSSEYSIFDPKLIDFYHLKFIQIVKSVKNELPAKRVDKIEKSLAIYKDATDIEELKLAAALAILKDLIAQEWRIKISENKVYLAPSQLVNTDNKMYLRQQLQIERDAHLNTESVVKFIRKMERNKLYKGLNISVKNLIGSSSLILSHIGKSDSIENVVKPYIQIVDNGRCSHTGYKLHEIWRYFRCTWSIPYKSTPGRNVFYLVRDASQPFHPIIGISALGNSVLQLGKRDNYIGWTLDTIKESLLPKYRESTCNTDIKGSKGISRKVSQKVIIENNDEYLSRIVPYSQFVLKSSLKYINSALEEIYSSDLLDKNEIIDPQLSTIVKLEWVLEGLKINQLNNKLSHDKNDFMRDTLSPLYTKKRASELLKLLQAKIDILTFMSTYSNPVEALKKLISYKGGRALNTSLQANRKTKIGSNIMEIIVCGAIPPYNEILGGKLVSMLMVSPVVISDYNKRYSNQISEIASRMKGKAVIRDSRLAFLGTTSLYHIGSSQYNRIKIPAPMGEIKYKKLGSTEGFGSIAFSSTTSKLITRLLIELEGGRRINNVFGEGTSPRMRLMKAGLTILGLPDAFIKHHTKRIIYGIDLAENSNEFLNGYTNDLNYYFPLDEDVTEQTEEIIKFWKERWLKNRLSNINILEKLNQFDKNSILVSNYIKEGEENS